MSGRENPQFALPAHSIDYKENLVPCEMRTGAFQLIEHASWSMADNFTNMERDIPVVVHFSTLSSTPRLSRLLLFSFPIGFGSGTL